MKNNSNLFLLTTPSYFMTIILCIVSFFTPIKLILLTTLILVLVDTLVKIIVQMKENMKDKDDLSFIRKLISNLRVIQSNKIRRTVWKLTAYSSIICLFYLVEIAIFGKPIYINTSIAGLIFTTELISICAALDKTLPGNIFTRLVSNFQKSISNSIEEKIKK